MQPPPGDAAGVGHVRQVFLPQLHIYIGEGPPGLLVRVHARLRRVGGRRRGARPAALGGRPCRGLAAALGAGQQRLLYLRPQKYPNTVKKV